LLVPFTDAERAVVVSATQDALDWDGYGPQPASFAEAAAVIDAAHERAGLDLIAQAGRKPDLVGFHGQTLLHRPRRQLSVQIGDPQVLADALDVPVVAAMRQDDLRAGGEGRRWCPPITRL
jgi:anhydro-N-acetylmuramic acid kinase